MRRSRLQPRPRPRRRLPAAALLLSLLAGLPAPAPLRADPRAEALAEDLVERLGGREAWEAARFFRFVFAGFRTHHWDRWDGRRRLEYVDRDGHAWLVLSNVQSRDGRAWKDGELLTGDEAAAALEAAHAAWINDTYWLLMPFKMRDPGVTLTYDGEESIDGAVHDKVLLTFDGVGLTPGDRYWAYIDRETGLLDRWAYVLEDFEEGRPPTVWLWREWQRHGGLLLSALRTNPESGRELRLEGIAVLESVPDSVFTSPAPVP